jgi:hypothetical protein
MYESKTIQSAATSVTASDGIKNAPNLRDLVLLKTRRASWRTLNTQMVAYDTPVSK